MFFHLPEHEISVLEAKVLQWNVQKMWDYEGNWRMFHRQFTDECEAHNCIACALLHTGRNTFFWFSARGAQPVADDTPMVGGGVASNLHTGGKRKCQPWQEKM